MSKAKRTQNKNKKAKSNTLERIKNPPQTAGLEYAQSSAKIMSSIIPIVGSLISELISGSVGAYINNQRSNWETSLIQGIEELYGNVSQLKESVDRQEQEIEEFKKKLETSNFNAVVTKATKIALTAESQQKLNLLRNAVLNTLLQSSPILVKQSLFLNLVDELTDWHLAILHLLNERYMIMYYMHSSLSPYGQVGFDRFIELAFPDMLSERDVYLQIAKDLIQKNLVYNDIPITPLKPDERDYHLVVNAAHARGSVVTSFGKEFLDFVKNPLNAKVESAVTEG